HREDREESREEQKREWGAGGSSPPAPHSLFVLRTVFLLCALCVLCREPLLLLLALARGGLDGLGLLGRLLNLIWGQLSADDSSFGLLDLQYLGPHLVGEPYILAQELLDVFLPLAEALAVEAEERPALLQGTAVGGDVDQVAEHVDPTVVQDLEFGGP